MQLNRGFTLIELAVVAFIVALLLGGVVLTLSAQEEQRANAETRRRLDAAVDAVIGFATVNRRLPCPAVVATGGVEAPAGGGTCTTSFGGFLPGRTLGVAPLDAQGFAVDAWGNRIRYAVANAVVAATCPSGAPHFTSQANLKANGVGCQPNDLLVCQSSGGTAPAAVPPSCNTAPSVTNQQTVAFLVLSTGKNGGVVAAGQGADELANTNGDAIFISREHGTQETTTGSYDDLMIWVPAGVLYSRLLAAGVLP
jgi:prepilin-type N-terminal cleavage/methylation domain-containing protein